MPKLNLRKRHWLPFRFVLAVFVASRLWTAFFVYCGHAQVPYLAPVPGGWAGVHNWWLNAWTTYDSFYYLHIALQGYMPKAANFFPFYPLVLKLAGSNIIVAAAWGIFVSNVALLLGLYYLYRLTRIDLNAKTARLCVFILAFFPTTVFFSAVYTESLFLALTVGAFYCVRTQRWAFAGLWITLAALTRNSGPLLAVMLALEYWQLRRQKTFTPRFAWLCAVLPLLAFVGFQVYLASKFGGLLPGVDSQEHFGRALSLPWMPIWRDLTTFSHGYFHITVYTNLAIVFLVFVLVWRNWKRLPWSYSIFTLGIALVNLCYAPAFWPYTASTARFQMATFPFSQMLSNEAKVLLRSKWRCWIALAFYLVISAVFSLFFGTKQTFIG